MMRTCHICGTEVEDRQSCPACLANFESREPSWRITLEERRQELELLLSGVLEFDLDKFYQRIQELMGRPVFSHELADTEAKQGNHRYNRG